MNSVKEIKDKVRAFCEKADERDMEMVYSSIGSKLEIENLSFTISLYVICSLAKTGHICKKLFKSAIFQRFFPSYLLIINVKTDPLPVIGAGRFPFLYMLCR